jgi:hypothetical protein
MYKDQKVRIYRSGQHGYRHLSEGMYMLVTEENGHVVAETWMHEITLRSLKEQLDLLPED